MAKDIYHEIVKRALIKDGWTITDDPYKIRLVKKTLKADLGAEKVQKRLLLRLKVSYGIRLFMIFTRLLVNIEFIEIS